MDDKNPRYSSIDKYIQSFPEDVQKKLTQIRLLIRKVAPEAQERISYRMPAFYLHGNLVYFGAHAHHIGFYPTSSGVTYFADELGHFRSSKGAIQFPMDQPLPIDLIRRIVEFRVAENSRKNVR